MRAFRFASATGRVFSRCDHEPGGKLPARCEVFWITNRGNQRCRGHGTDTGRGGETLAGLVTPVPAMKTLLQCIDLSDGVTKLLDHYGQNHTRQIGQTGIIIVPTIATSFTDCCSLLLIPTNRMMGRVTASQLASASAWSCLLRLM